MLRIVFFFKFRSKLLDRCQTSGSDSIGSNYIQGVSEKKAIEFWGAIKR